VREKFGHSFLPSFLPSFSIALDRKTAGGGVKQLSSSPKSPSANILLKQGEQNYQELPSPKKGEQTPYVPRNPSGNHIILYKAQSCLNSSLARNIYQYKLLQLIPTQPYQEQCLNSDKIYIYIYKGIFHFRNVHDENRDPKYILSPHTSTGLPPATTAWCCEPPNHITN